MKLKLTHLRYPLRTANLARGLVSAELDLRRFVDRSRHYFAGDPRYDLDCVTRGFADRRVDRSDDTGLLKRICDAYILASEREQSGAEAYRATGWWEQQRRGSLGDVIRALKARDTDALQEMYRKFYRDSCSAGLVALQRRTKDYFGGGMKERHRRFCLADTLYRLDYWKEQTEDRFPVDALAGPDIGNPFGVVVDGTLIRTGAEYQHYCAVRVAGLAGSGATVVEIGGGYGGMAYYLLRDWEQTTYINFDVPESVALMSYFLMKAFPERRFLLYGEGKLTEEALDAADVVLLPISELGSVPTRCADVAFSSNAMSDLSQDAMTMYLNDMARMTRGHFLFIGNGRGGAMVEETMGREHPGFRMVERKSSGWHDHILPDSGKVEFVYRVGAF